MTKLTKQKTTVAVVFGGVSPEHEVSRLSVTSVLSNLDRERYQVRMVGITKEGQWMLYTGPVEAISPGDWERLPEYLTPCVLSPDRTHHGLLLLEGNGWQVCPVDVVFPVLHGRNGEDGTIQGLLELAGIPCVGCGVMASANCMDKDTAKRLFTAAGIPNARWIILTREDLSRPEEVEQRILGAFGYPAFVKPANAGSSVGVSRAEDLESLKISLESAFAQDDKVIVEETIRGAEVECAVIGNDSPAASDVIGEIVPVRALYDYEGKYLDGSTDLYIPARLGEEQTQTIRRYAVEAYRALGCQGLARVDFFALPDGQSVILNEINTMPGFTNISMYPKLMMASGFTYGSLLDRLIQLALER